ncbi:MAG: caspase family protein, partial [Myxococcota bacterium]
MKRLRLSACAFVLTLMVFSWLAEGATVRRVALMVGTNDGGPGRVRLRYATSDAEALTRVLERLGGIRKQDRVTLTSPSSGELRAALADLASRVARERAAGTRVEALFYYSGHSNESALLLGQETFAYSELRTALAALDADVRVAILDSCASGALTRMKGGKKREPLSLDESAQVKGSAILTSASATEAAQESDQLGGSFFTHYLVSGLRGAADSDGDGRITLTEAYQFAYQETLRRTEKTQAGAQHAN